MAGTRPLGWQAFSIHPSLLQGLSKTPSYHWMKQNWGRHVSTGMNTTTWKNINTSGKPPPQACTLSVELQQALLTEVLPALTAPPWVSRALPCFRLLLFGRSLLRGPLHHCVWYEQPACLLPHLLQILPTTRLQPLPAALSECLLWKRTVTTGS